MKKLISTLNLSLLLLLSTGLNAAETSCVPALHITEFNIEIVKSYIPPETWYNDLYFTSLDEYKKYKRSYDLQTGSAKIDKEELICLPVSKATQHTRDSFEKGSSGPEYTYYTLN